MGFCWLRKMHSTAIVFVSDCVFSLLGTCSWSCFTSLSSSLLIGKSNYFVVLLMLVLFDNLLQRALRGPTDRTTHTYTIRDLNKIKRLDGKSCVARNHILLRFRW